MEEVCRGVELHHLTSTSILTSTSLLYHAQRHTLTSQHGDAGDGLASHSGRVFSSFDRDQEGCAARDGGGWWQHRCPATNLNGLYGRGADRPNGGVVWAAYRPAHYSLKRVRMSIRPAAF
ncbi:hypothetical protein CRUP_035712 [Coryphaenoides rupestris]|nr:hypothetical protein CRUP_035712 [Coryphaenoides rupestris]